MEEIAHTWCPVNSKVATPDTTVPPLLWSRLFYTVASVAVEFCKGNGGSLVLRITHRAIAEVVHMRYLASREATQAHSSTLADYFSGKLAADGLKKKNGGKREREATILSGAKSILKGSCSFSAAWL